MMTQTIDRRTISAMARINHRSTLPLKFLLASQSLNSLEVITSMYPNDVITFLLNSGHGESRLSGLVVPNLVQYAIQPPAGHGGPTEPACPAGPGDPNLLGG